MTIREMVPPHVVLEAIANNLPVVCFDTCGQGDAVNGKVGRKIPLSSPSQSARDFAKLLNELEKDRSLLKLLSENCKERQMELSWEEKAKVMVEWYKKGKCFEKAFEKKSIFFSNPSVSL